MAPGDGPQTIFVEINIALTCYFMWS
jgi:hypothetical protein